MTPTSLLLAKSNDSHFFDIQIFFTLSRLSEGSVSKFDKGRNNDIGDVACTDFNSGSEVMNFLSFSEHEILNAHKNKNIKKFRFSQAQISLKFYFSCS